MHIVLFSQTLKSQSSTVLCPRHSLASMKTKTLFKGSSCFDLGLALFVTWFIFLKIIEFLQHLFYDLFSMVITYREAVGWSRPPSQTRYSHEVKGSKHYRWSWSYDFDVSGMLVSWMCPVCQNFDWQLLCKYLIHVII